jgi:hypothetical protein
MNSGKLGCVLVRVYVCVCVCWRRVPLMLYNCAFATHDPINVSHFNKYMANHRLVLELDADWYKATRIRQLIGCGQIGSHLLFAAKLPFICMMH